MPEPLDEAIPQLLEDLPFLVAAPAKRSTIPSLRRN
jgi:hypothetical protein